MPTETCDRVPSPGSIYSHLFSCIFFGHFYHSLSNNVHGISYKTTRQHVIRYPSKMGMSSIVFQPFTTGDVTLFWDMYLCGRFISHQHKQPSDKLALKITPCLSNMTDWNKLPAKKSRGRPITKSAVLWDSCSKPFPKSMQKTHCERKKQHFSQFHQPPPEVGGRQHHQALVQQRQMLDDLNGCCPRWWYSKYILSRSFSGSYDSWPCTRNTDINICMYEREDWRGINS